jgi:hypothetical protein
VGVIGEDLRDGQAAPFRSATVAVMARTADIASFPDAHAANQVATLLRENGIACAVESELQENLGPIASPQDGGTMYHVRVAHEDGARARDVTADMFTAEWFLCTPQGHRYHPFHTATIAVLRAHVASHGDGDPKAREVGRLADLMQQHGWHTVNDAFHEGHLWNRHERDLDGAGLADWAHRCGCVHAHPHPPGS